MSAQNPPPVPVAAYPQPPARSNWPWVIGVVLLGGFGLVCLFFFLIFASIVGAMQGGAPTVATVPQYNQSIIREGSSDRIAHIDLEGVISASADPGQLSMVDHFSNVIDAAVKDDSVKAIVIRINSPGGEVTASDRLHHIIQKADKRKPVIAYLDTIAASGGYYSACACREIISHPSTFTGSIGVIMQSVKYEEMIQKIGVSMEVYKSGELKDLLSGTRATSPKEKALVDALIQETYTRFLEVVSEGRGKTMEELRASELTDGRIFSGAQALESGMVDQNGFIGDAYAKAMKLGGVSNATIVRYSPKIGFFDALSLVGSTTQKPARIEIDVSERLLPNLRSGVPLYLHLEGY